MIRNNHSDALALKATDPEHCLDCFRLIRTGEKYYLGNDGTVLCPNCVSSLLISEDFDTIQAIEQLAVDYGGGLLRVRREGAALIIAPGEVWRWLMRRRRQWTNRSPLGLSQGREPEQGIMSAQAYRHMLRLLFQPSGGTEQPT